MGKIWSWTGRKAWGRPSNQANKQLAVKDVAKKTHENKYLKPKTGKRGLENKDTRTRRPESEDPFTILKQEERATLYDFTKEKQLKGKKKKEQLKKIANNYIKR